MNQQTSQVCPSLRGSFDQVLFCGRNFGSMAPLRKISATSNSAQLNAIIRPDPSSLLPLHTARYYYDEWRSRYSITSAMGPTTSRQLRAALGISNRCHDLALA
ncbi:unnamed protein product [Cercospora beticola]|nr:unnamed protein product [Cercospora beticola]